MISFIKHSDSPTKEAKDEKGLEQFSPSMYIGNRYGGTVGNYEPSDKYTLKQYELQVDSLAGSPLVRINSNDLYFGGDKNKDSVAFNKAPGWGTAGSPYAGTPMKIQRVHFIGQSGPNGEAHEYYSFFLCSNPVQITKKAGVVANYDALDASKICLTDKTEQTDNAGVKEWNDLTWAEIESLPSNEQHKKRLIIGSSLAGLFKGVSPNTEFTQSCNPITENINLVTVSNGLVVPVPLESFIAEAVKNLISKVGNSFVTSLGSDGKATITTLECEDGVFTPSERKIKINCGDLGCESSS